MRVTGSPNLFSTCEDTYYRRLISKENIIAGACGMITFPATLGIFQHVLWKPLKVAAHSKLSPVCGLLSVGTSALLSCFMVSTVHDAFLGVFPMVSLTNQDAVTFTLLSLTQYYMFSKSFSRTLPSHVLKPGAFANKFIELVDYDVKVTKSQKCQIQYIGRSHGCHTCGKIYSPFYSVYKITLAKLNPEMFKTRALYYADHSPPMALAYAKGKGKAKGVLYPQCQSCSNLQSSCVRTVLKSTLIKLPAQGFVTHFFRFKLWKIWLPWPLIVSSDSILQLGADCVQFVIDRL